MSEEIIKILDDLAQRFGIAVDWTSQNAMPYIEEITRKIIRWELVSSVIWLIVGVLCCLSILGWIRAIKYAKKQSGEYTYSLWDIGYITLIVTSMLFGFAGIFLVIYQIFNITEIIIFPEKTIILYLKTLI